MDALKRFKSLRPRGCIFCHFCIAKNYSHMATSPYFLGRQKVGKKLVPRVSPYYYSLQNLSALIRKTRFTSVSLEQLRIEEDGLPNSAFCQG